MAQSPASLAPGEVQEGSGRPAKKQCRAASEVAEEGGGWLAELRKAVAAASSEEEKAQLHAQLKTIMDSFE